MEDAEFISGVVFKLEMTRWERNSNIAGQNLLLEHAIPLQRIRVRRAAELPQHFLANARAIQAIKEPIFTCIFDQPQNQQRTSKQPADRPQYDDRASSCQNSPNGSPPPDSDAENVDPNVDSTVRSTKRKIDFSAASPSARSSVDADQSLITNQSSIAILEHDDCNVRGRLVQRLALLKVIAPQRAMAAAVPHDQGHKRLEKTIKIHPAGVGHPGPLPSCGLREPASDSANASEDEDEGEDDDHAPQTAHGANTHRQTPYKKSANTVRLGQLLQKFNGTREGNASRGIWNHGQQATRCTSLASSRCRTRRELEKRQQTTQIWKDYKLSTRTTLGVGKGRVASHSLALDNKKQPVFKPARAKSFHTARGHPLASFLQMPFPMRSGRTGARVPETKLQQSQQQQQQQKQQQKYKHKHKQEEKVAMKKASMKTVMYEPCRNQQKVSKQHKQAEKTQTLGHTLNTVGLLTRIRRSLAC